MKLHIEYHFDMQEYWLYFFYRHDNAVVLMVPDPDMPDRYRPEYVATGATFEDIPTMKISQDMYDLLKEQLHPEQEALTNLTLKNYEREQGRVDKLMDHVMRLES